MKLLLTTIAAVLVVGCGELQQSAPAPEAKPVEPVVEAATPEPQTAKAPDISIHKAAYDGHIEAVKQHLAAGADVNAKDGIGWSVLDQALASKNEELVKFIKASGGNSNAGKSIYVASGIGDLKAVKQHLDTGKDVNAKNRDGVTPLHYAAWDAHKEIAELLIANGADVNAKADEFSYTPLDSAIANDRTETADLLRKHGGKTRAELKAEGK